MASKKIKTCQICKSPFKARRDAKTCSPACRKQLQRYLQAQSVERANRLESAMGREFHRLAAGLLKDHVLHAPLVLADERGSIQVADAAPPVAAPTPTPDLRVHEPPAPQVQAPETVTATPVIPEPLAATPAPVTQVPVTLEPAPIASEPVAVVPEPTPVVPEPAPVVPEQASVVPEPLAETAESLEASATQTTTAAPIAPEEVSTAPAEPALDATEPAQPVSSVVDTATAPKIIHLEDELSTESLEPSAMGDQQMEESSDSDGTDKPTRREHFSLFRFNKLAFMVTGAALAIMALVGGGSVLFLSKHGAQPSQPGNPATSYAVGNLPLNGVNNQLQIGGSGHLTINGQLKVTNGLVVAPTATPAAPTAGQIYYNQSTNTLYYYNGRQFVSLSPQHVTSIGGSSGAVSLNSSLSISNNQLSVSSTVLQQINGASGSRVTSLQGQTGALKLKAGPGITINGLTIGNSGVLGLTGTADQVSVSAATGHITLSLPQDIATTSTPTFGGLTLSNLNTGLVLSNGSGVLSSGTVDRNNASYLSGTLNVANGGTGAASFTSGGIIYGNGAGALQVTNGLANSTLVTNGAGVPSLSQTLPLQVQDNITHTGVLSSGSITAGFGAISTVNNISTTALVQAGSLQVDGGSFTIDNSGNFVSAGDGTIQGAGGLTIGVAGSTTGSLVLADSGSAFTTTIQGLAQAGQNQTIYLPASSAATDTVCLLTLGNCVGTGGSVTASGGTQNYITKFTNGAGNQIGNSLLFDNGTSVGVGTALPGASYLLDVNGNLHVGGTTTLDNTLTITAGGAGITGDILQSGTGTFGTGTGNVSLNGATSVTGTNTFNVGTGATTLGGVLNVTTGLTTLSGGLSVSNGATITGTTNINVSGTANTSIGNGAGTFGLTSTGLNVSTAGALSGVTGYTQNSGNFAQSGTGTFGTGTGNVSLNGATTISSTLAVQGANALTLGTASTNTGAIVFKGSGGAGTLTLQGPTTPDAGDYTLAIPAITANDTVCVLTLANCSASGAAGGDLTGNYPNPTIAALQGTTLTLSSLASGDVLQYNGSAIVNGHITNSNLTAGSFTNITGVGALTAGSIGGSFGNINIGSNTFTGNGSGLTNLNGSNISSGTVGDTYLSANVTLQGNTFNGASELVQLNGSSQLPAVSGVNLTNLNGSNIASGTVANARLVNSGALTVTAGAGLSGGGSVALGASTSLSVAYGSTASTSVQGNTSLTCASGTGNLSGGGNSVTLGAGGSCNNLTITNSPDFTGALTVEGSGGITVGVPGPSGTDGVINLANAANANLSVISSSAPSGSGNATFNLPVLAGGSSDTFCLLTLGNCSASGTAGGDLTGSYPNPTIAKLQGTTLTLSSLASGDVLQYNGSAIVNGHITNSNLTAGTFSNITGVGALTTGSIASGFGTISTGNNITTTATVQGGVVNATSTLELGGADINTAGTLSNVAYLNASNTFTGTTNTFNATGGTSLAITGAPAASGNSSLIQIGSALSSGPATGTYIGINAPTNSANLLTYQVAGSTKFSVSGGGSVTAASTISATGTGTSTAFLSYKPAGNPVLQNFLLSSDANPSFQINGDGKINWGAGGASATDTTLYRTAAGVLKTDGTFNAVTAYQLNGTQIVDSSRNLTNIGTITSGLINGQTISSSANFTGTLAVQGSSLTVGTPGTTIGTLNLSTSASNAREVILQGLNPSGSGNATIQIPTIAGGSTDVVCLVTLGNCAGSGGGITGTGTNGTLAVFTGTGSIGNSVITESGSAVSVAGTLAVTGAGSLMLGTAGPAGNTGAVVFNNSTNANTLTLQSGATASNLTLTLPTADGSNGNCLETNGLGVLSFQSCTGGAGGGVTSVDGLTGVLTINNSSGAGSAVTIDNAKADASTKGIATFNATNFTDNGSGTINTVQDIATSSSPVFVSPNATTGVNTGAGAGTQRIDASGNLVNIGTITSGLINGQTISSSANFTGTVAIQGSNALTLGTASTNTGAIVFKGSGGTGTLTLAGPTTPDTGNYTLTIPTITANDTVCVLTLGNCSASGTAGGDLTGSYPNPTIAKLQGTTLTLSSLASGDVLQYNGSAIVNGHITNSNLTAGTFSNITGVGALTTGSIASGFGTISTGNNITTTATVQGATVNATTTLQLGGADINTAGTLSNVAYLNASNTFTGTTNTFNATGGTSLAVTGAPTNSATSSLIQIGSAIALGNSAANGGTYIGLNEPSSGAGSAADFLNFQTNGVSQFKVTNSGSVSAGNVSGNNFVANGSGTTPSYKAVKSAGNPAFQNLLLAGDANPSFQINGSGQLNWGSGGASATDTTLYRTAAGVLKTDGTLNVGTAIQLNGTQIVDSSRNLTNIGTITSGLINGQTISSSANFTGTVAVQGANALALGTASTNTGAVTFYNSAGTHTVTLQGTAADTAANYTLTIPTLTGNDTLCVVTLSNCTAAGAASGDLTGTYPAPTIAKLQGTTLTLSSLASGDVLQYNGSAIVNGHITNSNLTAGSFTNITDVGTLASGLNIASGQTYKINGTDINTAGTLSNVAYLNASNTFTGTTNTFNATGGTSLAVTGAPTNSATSSLIQIGSAITGGNNSSNGGTYIGINEPTAAPGAAADFVNFEANGTSEFKVTAAGVVSANSYIQITSSALTSGAFSKSFTVGTGGVTANDVVVLANDGGNTRVIDSTTARDPRVIGVANGTVSSGSTTQIRLLGNAQVTADTGAVAIGDQLVVSSTSGQVTVDNNATTGILGYALSTKAGGSSGLVSVYIHPTNGQTNPTIPGNLTVQGTGTSSFGGNLTVTGTINGATITGGALSATAVNGLSVSAGTITNPTIAGTVTGSGSPTITGFGTISAGTYNSQTISSAANFTGTVTIQGSNALTLGVTGTSTGAIQFKGSTGASGTLTLIGPANPSTNTLTLPNETGTLCSTGSVCTGYAPSSGGNYIAKNAQDTSSASTTGNLLALTNTNTGAAGVLSLTNSGTNSALNILQSGTSEPAAGQALILANNNTTTPTGNLLDLQNKGISELHVDVSGNLVSIGNLQGTNITSTGTITLGALGTTDTSAVLCRNTSNIIASCSSTGTGAPFVQGGNSFGATAVLGTNDSNSLAFETNNTTQATIAVGGATTFQNSTDSTTAFQIQNQAGTSNLFVADTTNGRIGIDKAPTNGATLDINGSINASSYIQSNSQVSVTTNASSGYFGKGFTAGTGGVSINDVVVLVNDGGNPRVIDSTTPRDPRVYGVATGTATSGNTTTIALSGNFKVTADTAAVAIGDQLVVSSTSGQVTVDNNATTGILGYALQTKAGGSSGLVNVAIHPSNGQSTPRFQNTSDSTTAFQIQNAAGTSNLFVADTTNSRIGLGVTPITTAGSGLLQVGAASSTTAAQGISFGGDTVANLYRSAAGVLKTDGTFNAATALQVGGADINTAGTLTNVAYLNASNTFTGTTNTFSATGGNALAVTGAPTNSATTSLIQIGNAIAGGNSSANGGTYLSINAPSSGAGNAADFLNFETNGSIKFVVTSGGSAQASATFLLKNTSASAGTFVKQYTAGGTIVTGDAVSINSTGATVISSATARDPKVYGVSTFGTTVGNTTNVAVGGNTTVNADTAAINIGDQLVTTATAGVVTADNNATTGIIGHATTSKAGGSTGTVGVAINVVGGQSTPVFRNTSDSTTAFQIQNAAGTSNLFVADTTNSRIGLGVAPITTAGSGLLQVGAASSTTAAQGISFGGDTSANLYRSAAATLKTDASLTTGGQIFASGTGGSSAFKATKPASTSVLQNLLLSTDTNPSFQINGDGTINWGAGGASATDTTLFRSNAGELTTNGDLVVQGGDITTNQTTFNLINTTATTLNIGGAATTALNLGPGGATATSVNLAGGSGATGCTVDGATGNLTCTGNITGSGSGTIGYWSRSGTTLQPATAGDNVTTTGNISTTSTGTITSAGLLTGSAGLTITGGTANINATGSSATNIGNTGSGGAVAVQSASTIALTSGTTLSLTSTGANNINLTPGGTTNTGVLVKPTADSTAALQVQTAGSTPVLTVDTTNSLTTLRGSVDNASVGSTLLSGNCSGSHWSGTGTGPYTHSTGSVAALTCTITGGVTSGATYQITYNATPSQSTNRVLPAIGGTGGSSTIGTVTSQVQVLTTTTTANPTFTISSSTDTGTISNISIDLVTNSKAVLSVQNSSGVNDGELRVTGSVTAFGLAALQSNTTGVANVAFGPYALTSNTTGSDNTALGVSSLYSNTTGTANTATGTAALTYNTTGSENTANGFFALYLNSTGSYNTALGYQTLVNNTSGTGNTAVSGRSALYYNTTGSYNTASGYFALVNNTTASNNTASGSFALQSNTTGASNTALGYQALNYNTVGANSVALGQNALYASSSVAATLGTITGGSGYTNGTYNNVTMTNSSGPMATAPVANITVSGGAVTAVTLVSGGTGVDTTTVLSAAAASIGGTGSGFTVPVATLTTASNNIGLGYQAGYTSTAANANVTGSNNTFIGYNAGPGSTTQLQNASAIGTYSVVSASNAMTLGCVSGVNGCTVNTQVGIDTATPGYALDVNGNINTNTAYLLNGANINTGGTLSNVAYLDQSNTFTGTTNTFSATGGTSLAVTGAPTNSATASLIQIGSAISGGNSSSNGGTYIGLNAPSSGAGSAADLINLETNGTSKFKVTSAGYASATQAFLVTNSSATGGQFIKSYTAGGTISANDVVSIKSSGAAVISSATARDPEVYGVAPNAQTVGNTLNVVISGNATVNADSAAINIGDQLVTTATAGVVTADNNATTGIIGIATTSKAGGSSGTVGVAVRAVGGQSTPRFQNISDSTTAFQIQNAAGTSNLLVADTTNSRIGLGVTPITTAGSGLLQVGAASSTTAAQGISFGGSTTVNLYRSASGVLKTDGTFNAGTALQINGVDINTAGTLSNVAYLNASNTFTGTTNTFSATGGTSLAVTGAPTNSATASLIQIGSAIVGGNSSANGGTYLGLNEPGSGAGSAADYLNFQNNGAVKLKVTSAGALTSVSTITAATYNSTGTGSTAAYGAVKTASNTVLQNLLLSGDANPSFQILGDGTINWGAGGASATDTNLYRSDVNTLQTDSAFSVENNIYATGRISSELDTDVDTRVALDQAAGGAGKAGITFGPGTSSADTNLYRSAASTLTTDGTLNVATAYQLNGTQIVDSSRNLTNIGDAAINGGDITSTATTFNLLQSNVTTLNIGGAVDSGGINLAGGSSSTGCTIDGSTGNLACTGSITSSGGGAVGYFQRSGTTLSPATAGDNITTSGNISTTGGGSITSASTVTGTTLNGTTGVNTGAGAGTQRIDSSGNLVNIGSVSASGNISTSGGVLQVGGSGQSYVMGSLGLGVTNPQGALSIANSSWINAENASSTGFVNLFELNGDNQIQVGAALNIDGGIELPTDGGQLTLVDEAISSATAGTPEGYTFRVGSTNALSVYGESDGSGGAQNVRVAIGSSISPQYTLDVGGDVNTTGVYRINGSDINTAGTLSNVAYQNQANTFTQSQTISNNGGKTTLQLSNTAANVGLTIGGDTNLYRSAAATLKTDGTLVVGVPGTSAGSVATIDGTQTLTNKTLDNTNTATFKDTNFTLQDDGDATKQVNFQLSGIGTGTTRTITLQNTSGTVALLGATQTFSVAQTFSAGTQGIKVTGTPAPGTGITSLVQIGSAIAGGNAVTNGGTYLSVNVPGSGAGSAADIVNFQNNGTSVLTIGSTGATLHKNSTDSTTAFQIQNAAGTSNLFVADTTNTRIGLGVTPITTAGSGLLQVGAASSTTAAQGISFGGDTSANLYRSAAGVLKTDGGLVVGTLGSGGSVALCSNAGQIGTCSTGSGSPFVQGGNSFGATAVLGTNDSNSLTFETNNATQATIAVGGATTFQNSADSTSAFQIQNHAGTSNLLVADTTNTRIGIGKSAPSFTLDVVSASNDVAINVVSHTGIVSDTSEIQFNSRAAFGYDGTTQNALVEGASGKGIELQVNGATNALVLSSTGAATFQNASDSTTAFQIQNAGGTSNLLVADTTHTRIAIGQATAAYTLDVAGDINTSTLYRIGGVTMLQYNASTSGVFVGNSGNATQSGINNNALGVGALASLTTGAQNLAFGTGALASNQDGDNNVAIGTSALNNNVSGNQNVAIGRTALFASTGYDNTAIGYQAGYTSVSGNATTTGGNNTYIGYQAGDGSATQLNFATAIGAQAVVSQSNSVVLGCVSGVNGCTTTSKIGIDNATPSYTLDVAGDARFENLSNSSTAFQIQNSSGNNLLTANTSLAWADLSIGGSGYASGANLNFRNNSSSNTWDLETNSVGLGGTDGLNIYNWTDNAYVFALNNHGAATFKNSADSTAAFQIQNAGGTSNLFVADTTHGTIGIGTTPATTTTLYVWSGSSNTGQIINQDTGSTADLLDLQHNGTNVLTVGSVGNTTIETPTDSTTAFQVLDHTGSVALAVDTVNASVGIGVAPTSTDKLSLQSGGENLITANAIGGSNGLLQLQHSGTNVVTVGNTGNTTFKNSTDSTAGFQVQNASSNPYILVNTSGATLSLGDTSIASTIQIGNTTGGVTQVIHIGNNATASSVSTIVIGDLLGSNGSTTLIQGGTGSNAIKLTAGASGTITIGNTSANTIIIGVTGSGTVADNVSIDNSTGANSGTIILGGSGAATGTITIGHSTGSQIVNIGTGAVAAGKVNTVNIANVASATTGTNAVVIGSTATSTSGATSVNILAGNNSGSTVANGSRAGTDTDSTGIKVSLGDATSTSALCTNLASATAPTSGTAYELIDCSGTPVADYAENYPVASGVGVGDVVSMGSQMVDTYGTTGAGVADWNNPIGQITQLVKANQPYQSNIVGIVSDNNDDFSSVGYNLKSQDNPKPIALNGRVLVNVTTENGPIEPGDYVTVSATTPGYAMKATQAGYVIGQALGSYTGSGSGQVMVFVKNVYYPGPDASSYIQNGADASLANLSVSGNTTLANLDVTGDTTLSNLNVSGPSTLAGLTVTGDANVGGDLTVSGNATVNGSLTVTGPTTVADITVAGHIITAGGQPTVQVQTADGTPDPNNPNAQDATVTVSGNDTTGTITITTSDNPTAGDLAKILFSKSYGAAPHIVLSASNDKAAGLRFFKGATTKDDFMFNALDTPQANTTYTFDYFIAQ